jgi:outer membrane protein assembly factor BamB
MLRLLSLITAISTASLALADWPVFRGDSRMTGTTRAQLDVELKEKWTFKCGDMIESAPVIQGTTVYIGSYDKHVYAIDLNTGQQKWKTLLGPIKASPAVQGDLLIVGDVDGKVHALNSQSGKVLWTFETMGEITGGANFFEDTVLIGSHDSTLYCLTKDGQKKWEFKIDGPVNGAAAVAGDRTFVAGCDSILHVLDARTGKSLGTVDLGGQAAATAAVFGDVVYVGTMTNQVVAIDWKQLKKLWVFEPKRRQQPFYASAAVDENLVITGSRDKKIYAIDRKTGIEKWSFITEGMVDSSPVIIGERVYVGCLSTTGEFYVLDRTTGKQLQLIVLDSAVSGSVAVGNNSIVVGTEKGTLYCFGK